jgi:flagellar hook-basal body complex protein FliE
MTINTQDYPLGQLGNITFKPQITNQEINSKGAFDAVFDAALDIVNETNKYQKNADAMQQDFATGRTDNILSVLLAQQRAYSSLNFTVQVTNKIIESYREIMRMQI